MENNKKNLGEEKRLNKVAQGLLYEDVQSILIDKKSSTIEKYEKTPEDIFEGYKEKAKNREKIIIDEELMLYFIVFNTNKGTKYKGANNYVRKYNNMLDEINILAYELGIDINNAFKLIDKRNLKEIYSKDIPEKAVELQKKVKKYMEYREQICSAEISLLAPIF